MRGILISITAQWCNRIFNNIKTIDVRKNKPNLQVPFKVYVYCTKGAKPLIKPTPNRGRYIGVLLNGYVIGEFTVDRIDKYQFCYYEGRYNINDIDMIETNLSHPEFINYGKGKVLYGWHITDTILYAEPKELREFYTMCNKDDTETCGACSYLHIQHGTYPCDDDYACNCNVDNRKPLTRPPLSWCYVEETL